MTRPYEEIVSRLGPPAGDRAQRMTAFVDLLWPMLRDTSVSWIGFYLHLGGEELVLGPCRDKPACSPIGLHGACGRAFVTREPLVVRDVAELGDDYIACDPRDRSEVVIPLFDESGECWGVFDVDSHEPAAFSEDDIRGLRAALMKAGLTAEEKAPGIFMEL